MLRTRLTYANVMSTLLVFAALGGTSYAVTKLDANSVRSNHIRNGQVKRADLARNALDSSKVADGALLAQDFAAGQLPAGPRGPQGERGVEGPEGKRGRQGRRGEQGPRGGISAVRTQFFQAPAALADGDSQTYITFCPAGQRAIGGSVRGDDTLSEETRVVASRPVISQANSTAPTDGGTFTGWAATVFNPAGGNLGIRPEVWVVCIEE